MQGAQEAGKIARHRKRDMIRSCPAPYGEKGRRVYRIHLKYDTQLAKRKIRCCHPLKSGHDPFLGQCWQN